MCLQNIDKVIEIGESSNHEKWIRFTKAEFERSPEQCNDTNDQEYLTVVLLYNPQGQQYPYSCVLYKSGMSHNIQNCKMTLLPRRGLMTISREESLFTLVCVCQITQLTSHEHLPTVTNRFFRFDSSFTAIQHHRRHICFLDRRAT